MITLPNNCKCSSLTIFLKNWYTKQAKTHIDWNITYRFYDRGFPKPKQAMIKGMNHLKDLLDRQVPDLLVLLAQTATRNDSCYRRDNMGDPLGRLYKFPNP